MRFGGRRKPNWALWACLVSVLFFVFLLGGAFATLEWQPYQFFEDGARAARAYHHQRRQVRPDLLEPKRYVGTGVTVNRTGAWPGLTAVQGLFSEGAELRLLDMSGRVVHHWRTDFEATWPKPDHVFPPKNIPADELHYQTHGMALLRDGSVVLNFDNLGTAKLDKCGSVQWTVERATHHAVTANPDGSFWIPARKDLREVEDRLKLKPMSEADMLDSTGRYEDTLLLVGADGEIRAEFSLLDALDDGRFAPELYDAREMSVDDPTHLNDIELVTPELAARIRGVDSGDLLVSIRQMHMLAILDRQTGQVVWHQSGPWVRQHDADITADGQIEVFNNGDSRLRVDGIVGSSIMRLNPGTGETLTVYPRGDQARLFTRIMGAHQLLPNGNRLFTESMAGRIMEVDGTGQVVWEYVAVYDDTHAALIQSGQRFPPDYFTVGEWSCPGG